MRARTAKESAHQLVHDIGGRFTGWLVVNNIWLSRAVGEVMPALKQKLWWQGSSTLSDEQARLWGFNVFKEGPLKVHMFCRERVYISGCLYDEVWVAVGLNGLFGRSSHFKCIARKELVPMDDGAQATFLMCGRYGVNQWVLGPDGLTEKRFKSWLKIKMCRVLGEVMSKADAMDAQTESKAGTERELQVLQEEVAALKRRLEDVSNVRDLHFANLRQAEEALEGFQKELKGDEESREYSLRFLAKTYGLGSPVEKFIRECTGKRGMFQLHPDNLTDWVHDNIPSMRDANYEQLVLWLLLQMFQNMERIHSMKPREAGQKKGRKLGMGMGA